jgi:MoxR-like ATPase
MNKSEISLSEEVKVSTKGFIEVISKTFSRFIKLNKINIHPAVFVQGQPGIGKSQAIKEIAKRIKQETSKKVCVTDVRLQLFNPIDLRGIPVANLIEKVAIWLKPEIFKLSDDQDVVNILFLDELTAAPQSLQSAAYQIALDKKLGEHRLPNNTFVIAAGNRTSDRAVVYEMPSPLKNRFMHFELDNNFNDWLEWAETNEIHEDILQFLRNNPDKLNSMKMDTQSNILVTPRSWELLSHMLVALGGSLMDNQTVVASIVGNSVAYLMTRNIKSIQIEDITKGRIKEAPQDISELQQASEILESMIETYIHDQSDLVNVLKFLMTMPTDYAFKTFKRIAQSEILEFDLAEINEFNQFAQMIGNKLNA